MLGPMHFTVSPDAGALLRQDVEAEQLLAMRQLGTVGKPLRFLQLLAAQHQQPNLEQPPLSSVLCLQAQLATWAGQLQAVRAGGGDPQILGACAAARQDASEGVAESAVVTAGATAEATHPAKRMCWQGPNGSRALLRCTSRTDSSAPGRRDQLADAALRLGCGDESSSVSADFLQEQLRAFSRPCSAGEQLEDSEGLRRLLGGLVQALLAGPGESLFEEVYQPWLRGASPCRLAAEHSTFECYLSMLRSGMDWRAVGLLLRILRGSEDVGVGRHSEEAGAERREQRRKRRLSSSAQAAALRAASQDTESSMSLPGADFGAACCWRDTASSCTSSDESEDTQP
ncbi:hypothetical protein ABPG77_003950 [Micractinium sp. CCAP 211/92]